MWLNMHFTLNPTDISVLHDLYIMSCVTCGVRRCEWALLIGPNRKGSLPEDGDRPVYETSI